MMERRQVQSQPWCEKSVRSKELFEKPYLEAQWNGHMGWHKHLGVDY